MNGVSTIEPAVALGPVASLMWALVFGGAMLVLFGALLRRFLSYRGRAMRAESAEKVTPVLEPGPVLLNGRIETDDGGPAVRIEIDQVGKEWQHKNQWSHQWKEQQRHVHARPFRLKLPNDDAIRVVPDQSIRVVDALETETFKDNYRRRVAELCHKERVWISGTLSREGQQGGPRTAYRAGPESWVLKGSLLEPLEVASGKLSLQFDYWRVWYEKALKWVSPFVILVHVVLFGPYYLLFWTGKVDVATITGTSTYTTTSKGRTTTHYVIHAALSEKMGQRPVKTEARFGDYLRAKNGEIKKSTWLYTPVTSWLTQSGDKPVIGAAAVVLSCLIALFSVILVLVFKHGSRPWYEQRKVNEKGQGKLFVHAWAAQEPGRPGLYAARKPKS